MVFTTVINFIRAKGPDEIWRKRRIFKLAAHYIGRRRNCYSIAVRNVHRALVYATKGRKLKREDLKTLRETRITAACEQHGVSYPEFREAMSRSDIVLDRKILADLAAWEPYSFKALTDLARHRLHADGLNSVPALQNPPHVFTRGMLK